jgi:hypothetical protein
MTNNNTPALTTLDIVSIITLIFNITFFIVNIIIVTRIRWIDIKRSINLNFYELTLVKSLKRYYFYIGEINKLNSKLINEYTKTNDETKCRSFSEKTAIDLDNICEKCVNELSPYIIGFSPEAGKEIDKIFEEYYDSITKIFTVYSQPSLNSARQAKNQNDFSEKTKIFITSLNSLIKRYCPK